MGDGSDGNNKKIASKTEMNNLSLGISTNRFSRDLLHSFLGSSSCYVEVKDDDDEDDEIELNLGLSLGGRFGVDKSSDKLVRSSSIASCLPVVRDDNDAVAPTPAAYSGLMRTSSLPVETEDEWRKRKELQTLRRMEAKRRRSEKQKNLKGGKEKISLRSGSFTVEDRKDIEVHLRENLDREKYLGTVRRLSSSVGSKYDLSMRSDVALTKGKGSYVGNSSGVQGAGQLGSQESVESKGISFSSVSDLESKSLQEPSTGELSHTSIQSMQEESTRGVGPSETRANESSMSSSTVEPGVDTSSKRPDTSRLQGREIGKNALGDMPCVFTKGEGPSGRRVDGILYKYGKLGEEVRIMCVCHGSFHSPAEFVKHAGGTDVDHPLKHIVIKLS